MNIFLFLDLLFAKKITCKNKINKCQYIYKLYKMCNKFFLLNYFNFIIKK